MWQIQQTLLIPPKSDFPRWNLTKLTSNQTNWVAKVAIIVTKRFLPEHSS